MPRTSSYRHGRLAAALLALDVLLLAACAPSALDQVLPSADMRPPALLAAGPVDERRFVLAFDEEVTPLASSFWLEGGGQGAVALSLPEGGAATELSLAFPRPLDPGEDYRLAGEVEDSRGNSTRLVLSFCGYNPRPPRLVLGEVQTARNSSTLRPHRDFVELVARGGGNAGGVELSWIGSGKLLAYRFPAFEVAPGERIVVHLAPEGTAAEVDETGTGFDLSGGVDSSPAARDLWCRAGAIADGTGALALRARPGAPIDDSLFYAEEEKSGLLPEGRLRDLVGEMAFSGRWIGPGGAPAYEDGFRWKASSSRSLVRLDEGWGPSSWGLSEAGGQSPGSAAP